MTAEEVCRRILEEHEELRTLLNEIEVLAKEFEDGNAELGRTLRGRGLGLYAKFATHIDLEDEILLPLLRRAEPSGHEYADQVAREHLEQRELLSYLIRRLEEQSLPTLLISRELRNFAEYLRLDMVREEETALAESVSGTS